MANEGLKRSPHPGWGDFLGHHQDADITFLGAGSPKETKASFATSQHAGWGGRSNQWWFMAHISYAAEKWPAWNSCRQANEPECWTANWGFQWVDRRASSVVQQVLLWDNLSGTSKGNKPTFTLPETNITRIIFRGYVSFRECTIIFFQPKFTEILRFGDLLGLFSHDQPNVWGWSLLTVAEWPALCFFTVGSPPSCKLGWKNFCR